MEYLPAVLSAVLCLTVSSSGNASDPICNFTPIGQVEFLASPFSCSQYFKCLNGTKSVEECPACLLFSQMAQKCVGEEFAECNGYSGPHATDSDLSSSSEARPCSRINSNSATSTTIKIPTTITTSSATTQTTSSTATTRIIPTTPETTSSTATTKTTATTAETTTSTATSSSATTKTTPTTPKTTSSTTATTKATATTAKTTTSTATSSSPTAKKTPITSKTITSTATAPSSSTRKTPTCTTTESSLEHSYYLLDRTQCGQYIDCFRGYEYTMDCPSETYYSEQDNKCDTEEKSDCCQRDSSKC